MTATTNDTCWKERFQSLLSNIHSSIESLVGWMYSNKLKLNAQKAEVLPVASTSHLSSFGGESARIDGKRVPFSSSVRNLWVHHLDQTLSMQTTHQLCMPYSVHRTKKNSFNPTIPAESNCPARFVSHNTPAWLLQFHPCMITVQADFMLIQSPKERCKTRF